MKDIHSLVSLGGAESSATAITDGGVIVGWSADVAGNTRAFLFNPTANSLTDVQSLLPFGATCLAAPRTQSTTCEQRTLRNPDLFLENLIDRQMQFN
jgi:probable HAF family extracellular repeat protein